MTYRHTLLSLFLIVSLASIAWFTYFTESRAHKAEPIVNNVPDAFMEDVVAVIMDKEGNPKMRIETPKMVHFLKDDTTRLLTPHLTLYRGTPEPWYITSHYAKAAQGIESVHFWENVQIDHAADLHSPTTTIKTSTLTVYPNKQTAETSDLITMMQPNLTVNAIGMFANMSTGDIKLLSNARGEYVPEQTD